MSGETHHTRPLLDEGDSTYHKLEQATEKKNHRAEIRSDIGMLLITSVLLLSQFSPAHAVSALCLGGILTLTSSDFVRQAFSDQKKVSTRPETRISDSRLKKTQNFFASRLGILRTCEIITSIAAVTLAVFVGLPSIGLIGGFVAFGIGASLVIGKHIKNKIQDNPHKNKLVPQQVNSHPTPATKFNTQSLTRQNTLGSDGMQKSEAVKLLEEIIPRTPDKSRNPHTKAPRRPSNKALEAVSHSRDPPAQAPGLK